MTNARTWTISIVALLALVAAALVVTSAVSFAQESPTETPVASADADTDAADATEDADAADDAEATDSDAADDGGDITDESDEGGDSDEGSDDSDGSDGHGSGRNCPNKDGRSDDTSTETAIS